MPINLYKIIKTNVLFVRVYYAYIAIKSENSLFSHGMKKIKFLYIYIYKRKT